MSYLNFVKRPPFTSIPLETSNRIDHEAVARQAWQADDNRYKRAAQQHTAGQELNELY